MSFRFSIEARDGKARAGLIVTPHGATETPVFMPVGTLGYENRVLRIRARLEPGRTPLSYCVGFSPCCFCLTK